MTCTSSTAAEVKADARRAPPRQGTPRICLLAFSAIADDPRVRRQGDAFYRAGWEVVGIGLPGERSEPPEWSIAAASGGGAAANAAGDRRLGAYRRVRRLLGRIVRALELVAVRLCPPAAEPVYWRGTRHFRAIAELASRRAADVWLANDWNTLPLAARLARRNGGVYGYDSHELATEEYAEKPHWRRWVRPFVHAIEKRHIGAAVVTSAVSPGIAARLDRLYSLPRGTLAIRNTPAYAAAAFRPTGAGIRVLYHGIVAPGRGLEAAIASVADWRREFDLAIRGPANPGFAAELRGRIAGLGLENRVALLEPVPMTALVREAAVFDIGFFALPGHSAHNEYALPNKIFEYIMAGLCLCVSELHEIATIVRQYRVGVTISRVEPAAIAAAINSLDREAIDRCKRNSLAAAKGLCWESESERLVAAYAAVAAQAAR